VSDDQTVAKSDALRIFEILKRVVPPIVDGREAILQMQDEGSRNWRQMEWIGFWFEHLVETRIAPLLGARSGPTIGNVTFDLQLSRIWDLKVHPEQAGLTAILNDREACNFVVENLGGLGFIIVLGNATYDDQLSSFKAWHDSLKGGNSKYEFARIDRGAPSRRRKVAFVPVSALAIWLADKDEVAQAVNSGWLREFQTGMRNSDGSKRRAKYLLDLSRVPPQNVVATLTFLDENA
jgi:hypothetical protein